MILRNTCLLMSHTSSYSLLLYPDAISDTFANDYVYLYLEIFKMYIFSVQMSLCIMCVFGNVYFFAEPLDMDENTEEQVLL